MTNKMVAKDFLQARIAKLRQFKVRRVEKDEEDGLSYFKPGTWQTGFRSN